MRFGSSAREGPGVSFLGGGGGGRSKRIGLLCTKENDEGVASLLTRAEGRSSTEGWQLVLFFIVWIRGSLLQSACASCQ